MKKISLVINADDFGASHNHNEGIKYCFSKKFISRTTIIVNMPGYEEAIQIAKDNCFFNHVGLHLNLVEGTPLTEAIKKTSLCTDGVFNGSLMSGRNRLWVNSFVSRALYEEIEAQIQKYLKTGFTLRHVDSHRHSHTNLSVWHVLLLLLEKYEFQSVRLSRNLPREVYKKFSLRNLYKIFYNSKIGKFNSLRADDCISYFGSIDDVDKELLISDDLVNCEMMIHPVMRNGKLEEAVSVNNIEVWLQNHPFVNMRGN